MDQERQKLAREIRAGNLSKFPELFRITCRSNEHIWVPNASKQDRHLKKLVVIKILELANVSVNNAFHASYLESHCVLCKKPRIVIRATIKDSETNENITITHYP